MAVDQFGNPLTEEELYRLMMQQQQMGLLPGLLGGPAVDTFSGIPSSLPAYGPAAGLGPSAYMGAPQGMPTYNQSPALAAPSLMVDTQAGMATVPEITASQDVNLAGMPFAGAVTGANELINQAPFVAANPLSVLAKTEMVPNVFNYDAVPAVQ